MGEGDDRRGWTIADLERLREDSQAAYAAYEMAVMDRVGADVYMAVRSRWPAD
jgi:hypothetical protein